VGGFQQNYGGKRNVQKLLTLHFHYLYILHFTVLHFERLMEY